MMPRPLKAVFAALLLAAPTAPLPAAEPGESAWVDLAGPRLRDAWLNPLGSWEVVGDVAIKADDPKRLAAEPGEGVIYNGPTGKTTNLVTKEHYGDVELQAEFFIPKGSNSGIKFEGVYEIQILDSHGKTKPLDGSDCGGIYPRAELLPRYHHIDDGYAPKVNACKAPGEWQTLEITFRAPRFDAEGMKVADARFDRVVLNGQVVQEGVALKSPTGHAWHLKEKPAGPILLQADHGPVAFRKLRVRPL